MSKEMPEWIKCSFGQGFKQAWLDANYTPPLSRPTRDVIRVVGDRQRRRDEKLIRDLAMIERKRWIRVRQELAKQLRRHRAEQQQIKRYKAFKRAQAISDFRKSEIIALARSMEIVSIARMCNTRYIQKGFYST